MKPSGYRFCGGEGVKFYKTADRQGIVDYVMYLIEHYDLLIVSKSVCLSACVRVCLRVCIRVDLGLSCPCLCLLSRLCNVVLSVCPE